MSQAIDELVEAVARRRFELTRAELAIVVDATRGLSVTDIAKLRGMKYSSIKKQSHAICAKSGARSLAFTAVMVLRGALLEAADVTPVE